MATKELVLQVGTEGGGVCIYRSADDAGAYRFHAEGIGVYLDENDDEDWRQWTTAPVDTIEEALRSIAVDGSWIYWHPMMVLHEYRRVVWQYVQETLRSVTGDPPEVWHGSHQRWLAVCSEG